METSFTEQIEAAIQEARREAAQPRPTPAQNVATDATEDNTVPPPSHQSSDPFVADEARPAKKS